jgi:hypothetical protein
MKPNKLLSILFVGILTLSIAMPLLNLQPAQAQEGVFKNTFPLIGALPNPVGVGQQTLITVGITHATAWPQPGWYGMTVTVTKPDGTTETLGPVTTDTTGMTGVDYIPLQVGTYYLVANFPEQKVEVTAAGTLVNTTMKASTSEQYPLVVTQEPRQYYPGVPLPTEYWTRPINAQFREWQSIAGNWLNVRGYDNRLPPDNSDAPETAHLLWTRPYAEGGLVGGVDMDVLNMDQISYEHGDAYEGKWSNPVIMNGILFYTQHAAQTAMTAFNATGYETEQTTVAVDLHTGKVLWDKVLGNNERQAFGQIMYWKTMNMYGAFSYLWTTVGTTWKAYDPFTGRWEYTITGVPSGSRTVGPNGEILIYTVNTANGWMTMWNSTHNVYNTYMKYYLSRPADAPLAEYYSGRWRPHGITFNGTEGIQWNVTIPTGLSGAIQLVAGNDVILGGNTNWSGGAAVPNPQFWALSIKDQDRGRLLYNKVWTLPQADVHVDVPGSEPYSLEDDIFVVSVKETRVHYGFRLTTGEQVWGPTSPPDPWLNVFTNLYMNPWGAAVIKYGKLYTAGMGGVVNAFDIKDGQHLWTYNLSDPYTEQLFSSEWPTPITFIVDGKIYLFTQEHSANTPIARGAPAACIDAETGEEIWRIDGLRLGSRWGGQPIIGDSIIAGFSSYDNKVVAIGKGPTQTTLSAPDVSIPLDSMVVLKGSVTDISPGTKDDGLMMRFPNGVPAVSDDNMSEWMKYVHMHFPMPMATGVSVTLSVVDSNGNYRDIGTTTSDTDGFFSFTWKPDIEGKYTVYASFEGSNSYYSSHAVTAFEVEAAHSTPTPTTSTTTSMADMYILPGIVAIIIVIAVGFAITILVLRKRP